LAQQVTTQKKTNKDYDEQKPMQGLLSEAPTRTILVSIDTPNTNWPINESLDELEQLASTAGATCVDRLVQHLAVPNPATLLGSGKVEELKQLVQFHNCDAVIFDLELKPNQHRNL